MMAVTKWVNIVFLFIWCDGSYPGSRWCVRVTVSLKHLNLLALFQFWPALQRGRGRRAALRARSVHHAGAHAVVAVVTFLRNGHRGHAARSERHPKLWPQQFHAPESHSPTRSSHCLRLGLWGQGHRSAGDPGECWRRARQRLFLSNHTATVDIGNLVAIVKYVHTSAFPSH